MRPSLRLVIADCSMWTFFSLSVGAILPLGRTLKRASQRIPDQAQVTLIRSSLDEVNEQLTFNAALNALPKSIETGRGACYTKGGG